ncbi:D-sedoheptulose-7-phosphate isomerase [Mucisphaera calidilacus]|uniref:Phosphoheptose isomerase n=1 Tax=Mucisphaera calidilacus TaxID=2527982 RepID=A0A518BTV8_9BACT|nr:SIS domain-containing protein [Mucisphaera calidilacus]QDU70411.1 Phosphoheptose isomerase [Mucisphaera calidilacus]
MRDDVLDDMVKCYPELGSLREDVRAAGVMLIDAFRAGGKVLIAGNGGSAADADHWSGELLKGFESRRPLLSSERAGLSEGLAVGLQRGLPCIPLTGFSALSTAVCNDMDPSLVFAQLVMALGRSGDVFVGLSTSGDALNVCSAAEVARSRGMRVLGMTGSGGGALASWCDICVRVPETRTSRVQELHLPVYHALCLLVEGALFGGDSEY